MSHKLPITATFPGGNGKDNPKPLTIKNYHLSKEELKLKLKDYKCVALHARDNVQKQVTGKVEIDPATGKPKTGIVFMPDPPFFYL